MAVVILTARGAELYNVLLGKPRDHWFNTKQIAEMSGKNQLSPNDRDLLNEMVERGYILKKEQKPATGLGRPMFLFQCA